MADGIVSPPRDRAPAAEEAPVPPALAQLTAVLAETQQSMQRLTERLATLEARSTPAAPSRPAASSARATPKRVAGQLPAVAAALAALSLDPASLPALPQAPPELTRPMAAPADRLAETTLAARALAEVRRWQQEPLEDTESADDGELPDPAGDGAPAAGSSAVLTAAVLRALLPNDRPDQSLLFRAVAAPTPPSAKLPPHAVWGPRWVPTVAALADFGPPIRDIQSRGNPRNVEEAIILFSALHHLRQNNLEARFVSCWRAVPSACGTLTRATCHGRRFRRLRRYLVLSRSRPT
jgi:hypothetical protein